MRTLLQARFSMVEKQRDMQQAVRHLDGIPLDHCFHIAQMWCLIIEDCESHFKDLLLTSTKYFSSIGNLCESSIVSTARRVHFHQFRPHTVKNRASIAKPLSVRWQISTLVNSA
jgi:hypothetical protein